MIRFDEKSDLSDAELLALNASSKDNEPLGVLYIRYMPLVYGVCLKYLRQADEATDAVAAIYELVAKKADKYEIREFRTWLYSVTKNYCLAELSKKSTFTTEFSDNIMEIDTLDTLLESQDKEAQLAALQRCLDSLPEKQQKCINEFYFNNKSYSDIVVEQQFSIKSVKSSIQNGRRNLKLCLEKL